LFIERNPFPANNGALNILRFLFYFRFSLRNTATLEACGCYATLEISTGDLWRYCNAP